MLMIANHGTKFSTVFENAGDIAVVITEPVVSHALTEWLAEQNALARIGGVYTIIDRKLEDDKVGIRELRDGWTRVQREIAAFQPDTKRILLMVDSRMLYVALPGLKASQSTADMDAVHGSLFQYGDYILVPTYRHSTDKHSEQWRNRDLARCLKLTKPNEPLEYSTTLPRRLSGDVVLDFETSGLDATTDYITTLGVQWSDTGRALITEGVEDQLAWLMTQPIDNLIFHNAQFDLGFTSAPFRKHFYGKIRDTMILARARGELIATLKHLGNVYTARPGNYSWLPATGVHDFDSPDYVCEDIDVTWRLWKLWKLESNKPVNELMQRAVKVACEQTLTGTYIDTSKLSTLVIDGTAHILRLKAELEAKYGCDPGQTDVLTSRLREMGYQLSKQTKTGKDALTAEVLEEQGLLDILEYRRACKLDSAFVGKMQALVRKDSTIPHRQTILGAKTGRTTMTEFNHQQLPKSGPGKGLYVSRFEGGSVFNLDMKQAEVRVACWYAQDEVLAKALLSGDMHRENAARGFNKPAVEVTDQERFEAKALIFRSIFGGGPTNDAQKRVHAYMTKEFNKLFTWIDNQKRKGQRDLQVTDYLGKVTNMLDKFDFSGKWSCGRLAINAPVQGTSSHVAIWLTVHLYELFEQMSLSSRVNFGVHDSIYGEIYPGEENMVIAACQQCFRDLNTSVFAELFPMLKTLQMEGELQIAKTWGDCKKAEVILCSSFIIEGSLPF